MAKVTIDLSPDTYRHVLQIAHEQHQSISEVLREILRDEVLKAKKPKRKHVNKYAK